MSHNAPARRMASRIAPALASVSCELRPRIGVGHDPRPRLQGDPPRLHHQRADGDAEVEVAAQVEVAERAAVEAARRRLQLVDQLHGADLRGAGERPRGEGRHQRVQRVLARRELARHRAHQVHHVAVALDRHQLGDGDRPEAAHAPEVVAAEVHQHEVLGPLLHVRPQGLLEPLVRPRGRRPAAGCRPGAASPRGRSRPGPASPATPRRWRCRRPSGSTCTATG